MGIVDIRARVTRAKVSRRTGTLGGFRSEEPR